MSKNFTRFQLAPGRGDEATKTREMYTEVGRTIVQLSTIENELALIFYELTGFRISSTTETMAPFYAQSRFEGKLLLVDLLIRLEGSDEAIKRWQKVTKDLKKHKGVRNLVAHQHLATSFPDREGRVNVWLSPGELHLKWSTKDDTLVPVKGRALPIAEIHSTANALEKIRVDLRSLWQFLEDEKLPLEERSDYIPPEEDE